jgi:hypothetical protein
MGPKVSVKTSKVVESSSESIIEEKKKSVKKSTPKVELMKKLRLRVKN